MRVLWAALNVREAVAVHPLGQEPFSTLSAASIDLADKFWRSE